MARKPRILLMGGDADHNVGDRAILSALVDCIKDHDRDAEIAIVGDAHHLQPIPGVTRIVRRGTRGMTALVRSAFSADRIVIAGGGLFQDDDSRIKMPYWAARLVLLRLFNSQLIGHAIGAGPLDHADSRIAALIACGALRRVSVRDQLARATLAGCTGRPIEIVPDPAFMLAPAPREEAATFLRNIGLSPLRPIIAVTVRQWFHVRGGFVPKVTKVKSGITVKRDAARLASLLDAIASCVGELARRLNAGVLLLPGYNVGHEADDVACESLAQRLNGLAVRIAHVDDPRLYKALLGHASLVIASRMHPLILAAGMGVPFVGLSYNQKFDGLFDLLGLQARPLPLDEFPDRWDSRVLLAEAEAAMSNSDGLQQRADSLAASVRRRTLDAVFGVTEDSPMGGAGA